ncbi:MAG: hypothetical protein J6J81_02060, partial [Oscillospiraceae bacterium]|nr:hypothetical protein [Oscillospiraceae bacterium]
PTERPRAKRSLSATKGPPGSNPKQKHFFSTGRGDFSLGQRKVGAANPPPLSRRHPAVIHRIPCTETVHSPPQRGGKNIHFMVTTVTPFSPSP